MNESGSKFIQPLRAFERVIAPAQAIFYTGNKYPSLDNSFIFTSYNDQSLHAMKIAENNTKTFVHDLVIDFGHKTPDNIILVAESPAGDIYYGGYDIYKVESVNSVSKQFVFPIGTNLSSGVNIKEMNVLRENSTLLLHTSYDGALPKGTVQLKIPADLLDGIYSVTAAPSNDSALMDKLAPKSLITHKIETDSKSRTSLVLITLEKPGDLNISVNGADELD